MARSNNRRAASQGPPPDGRSGPVIAGQPGQPGQHRHAEPAADNGSVLRALALVAVVVGLVALTAAACVLSYSDVHAFALSAGVSKSLARIYPAIADAALVVSGCAVLALRGAGLISRIYGWLCFVVLLAALAATSVMHVAAITMPSKAAEITAAVFPWAVVLIAFGLLLALLRHARRRRPSHRASALAGTTAVQLDRPPPSWPPPGPPRPAPGLAVNPALASGPAGASGAAADGSGSAAPHGPAAAGVAGLGFAAPGAVALPGMTGGRTPTAGSTPETSTNAGTVPATAAASGSQPETPAADGPLSESLAAAGQGTSATDSTLPESAAAAEPGATPEPTSHPYGPGSYQAGAAGPGSLRTGWPELPIPQQPARHTGWPGQGSETIPGEGLSGEATRDTAPNPIAAPAGGPSGAGPSGFGGPSGPSPTGPSPTGPSPSGPFQRPEPATDAPPRLAAPPAEMQLRARGQRPPSTGPIQPPAGPAASHPATQDQATASQQQTPSQPQQAYPFAPPQAPSPFAVAEEQDPADQPLPAPYDAEAHPPVMPPSGLPADSYHGDTVPRGEINAAPTPAVTTTGETTGEADSGSASSAPPTLDRPRSSPTPPTE